MSDQSKNEKSHDVRIHIDRVAYDSPNPTNGHDLYKLAGLGKHKDLFREDSGNHEDELVPNDETKIKLKPDEHFYSQKEINIIVNARKKYVTATKLSFSEIVALAFNPPPIGPNILLTVTYRNGPRKNLEGTLLEGQTVYVKNGMIFDVTATDKS